LLRCPNAKTACAPASTSFIARSLRKDWIEEIFEK
jgi:hypothetical protein